MGRQMLMLSTVFAHLHKHIHTHARTRIHIQTKNRKKNTRFKRSYATVTQQATPIYQLKKTYPTT